MKKTYNVVLEIEASSIDRVMNMIERSGISDTDLLKSICIYAEEENYNDDE